MIEELVNFIRLGIKVYFVSTDPAVEELENEHPLLEKAGKGELLRRFLVKYDHRYADLEWTAYDGDVAEDEAHWLEYFSTAGAFNLEQYRLEHWPEGQHLIVTAGAGTGKTTVMLDRVMYLKHRHPHLPLKRMVMLTFTNEAAQHMKERLMKRLAAYYECTRKRVYLTWIEEAGEWFIGTIHSFAHQIIKEEGASLGFPSPPKIRSFAHEKKRLIEKWFDRYAVEHPDKVEPFRYIPFYVIVNGIYHLMEKMEQKSLHEEEMADADYGEDEWAAQDLLKYVIGHVQQELHEWKKERQEMELHDLLRRLKPLMRQRPSAVPVTYLLVDEFQDTDEVQIQFFLWLLQWTGAVIFAVGDVKQSIYRFRGAEYTAFRQLAEQLERRGEPVERVSLRKNYRSEPRLLSQMDRMFAHWATVVDRFSYSSADRLIPAKDESVEEPVGLFFPRLDDAELKVLLKQLEGKDVAILVRSNRQVEEMAERCERLGFFVAAKRKGRFFRTLPVREFYLLVRRFTHPAVWRDRYLFHLSSYGQRQVSLPQVLLEYRPDRMGIADLLQPYDRFPEAESRLRHYSAIDVLEQLVRQLKPDERYARRLFAWLKENSEADEETMRREVAFRRQEYAMNLEHLFYLLKKEFGRYPVSLFELEKYLAIQMGSNTTETELRPPDAEHHWIKVMTVHQAKGLEFDYVLLPYTDDPFVRSHGTRVILQKNGDRWQVGYHFQWKDRRIVNSHMKAMEEDEEKEMIGEETRLLYVALTRAKKAVYAVGTDHSRRGSVSSWRSLLVKEVVADVSG